MVPGAPVSVPGVPGVVPAAPVSVPGAPGVVPGVARDVCDELTDVPEIKDVRVFPIFFSFSSDQLSV